MARAPDYEFYCPRCKKKASTTDPIFRNFVRRLELPIFHCNECRLIYIDKPTVRRIISEWRKGGLTIRNMTLKALYQECLEELKRIVNSHFVSNLGYRKARFLKRSKTPTS